MDCRFGVGSAYNTPNQDFSLIFFQTLFETTKVGSNDTSFPKLVFLADGHDDGMEFNTTSSNSRYPAWSTVISPSFNAYMWADAVAISRIAAMAGKTDVSKTYHSKQMQSRQRCNNSCGIPNASSSSCLQDDEERDGYKIKSAHSYL